MKVGVINIPTSVGAKAWRKCFLLIRARCSFFGVNEAFAPAAKALYIGLAFAHGFGQYGARKSPNPVFWRRKHWRKVSGRVIKLHAQLGRYAEWPGFNDARYVTEVILHRRGRPHLPQVVVLCTHWVPEGPKVTNADRFRARAASKAEIRELILDHLAAGRIVILMGDFNIYDVFDLDIPGFHWVRGQGVDKVAVIVPAGYELTAADFETFEAPTDHEHGVAATVRVRQKESK